MRPIVLLTAFSAASFAQSSGSLSADAKAFWTGIKNNVLRAAEKMPEEHWSYKPAPEVRSFGGIVAHVADGNYLICGAANGEKRELTVEKTKSSKADIIAALKESFAYCDAAYDGMTDAKATEPIKLFGRDRVRISALWMNISHDNEHYGNLVTYMRAKGLVPPSSEPRPAQ